MGLGAKLAWMALGTALVGTGCGSSGGTGSTSTGTGGATTATGGGGSGGSGPTYGDSSLAACFTMKCSTQIAACKADPECPAYLACLDACPLAANGDADPACVEKCPTGSGTQSTMAAGAVDTCRTSGAGAACLICAAPPPAYTTPVLQQTCPNPSMETNPCFKCEDEKCCDSYVNCKDDAECQALKTCLGSCTGTDPSCQKDCVAQHPNGADGMGSLFACMRVLCFADQIMCDHCERTADIECLYGTCGDAYAAFLSGPDGYALEACIVACPVDDTACDQGCYTTYPDAYQRYGDITNCLASCAAP